MCEEKTSCFTAKTRRKNGVPKLQTMIDCFPYGEIRELQMEAMREISETEETTILEMGTGSGKTAIGCATLLAEAAEGNVPTIYLTPNKTLVDQIRRMFPESVTIMGRSEYPCLYYTKQSQEVTAQESPCYMLKCGHRVDQTTGATEEDGVEPCPYFMAKYQARMAAYQGKVVVSTAAFFLRNRLSVKSWQEFVPARVVLDEAHRIARIARSIFQHSISEVHLRRCIEVLRNYDRPQALVLARFRQKFMRIVRRRAMARPILMKEEELTALLTILNDADSTRIGKAARQAIEDGTLMVDRDRHVLKALEALSRGIPRMIAALYYSLGDEERNPLNYVVGFYHQVQEGEETSARRANYRLVVKSYFVGPVIRKALGKRVLAYSATIGQPEIFKFETGLSGAFSSFAPPFSNDNTRIYLPTDTPDLSAKKRRRDDVKKTIKRMVLAGKRFAERGIRSLHLVISEEERQQFLARAQAEGFDVISYDGKGRSAREVAAAFARGEGTALLGTASQYGEGVDLPRKLAPVIFFLRPGYPHPDDPEAQFEVRRFGEGQRWAIWNWRVLIEALQGRGRNLRGAEDLGVCIFMSQQFRRVLGGLPRTLESAYRGSLRFDAVVEDAMKLLEQ